MGNYKTITKGMLLALMVMLLSVPVFAATGNADIYINDVKQTMSKDMPQAFMDKDGRIQIPLRFIVEVMGSTIKWDGKTQQANINNGQIILILNRKVLITPDGESLMDTVPFIKNGSTFVPIRFVSEALGYEVKYKFISGVNCVFIYGGKASTTPTTPTIPTTPSSELYRPEDAQSYKPIPGVTPMVTEANKHTIMDNSQYIGLNEWNTTVRPVGSNFEQERTYLNTIVGGAGYGFAQDGEMMIGDVDSLKDQETGVTGQSISIYKSNEGTNARELCIRGWLTKKVTSPSNSQVGLHNLNLEAIRYYSKSDSDGKAIVAFLDKAFNSGKAPEFGKVMTFGQTKVKFLDRDGYGLRVIFYE